MSTLENLESSHCWDEGEFRIHGLSALANTGNFWPAYSIDRISGTVDAPEEVVRPYAVRTQAFISEDFAKKTGLSLGLQRVRQDAQLNG
ncbi:hypothetical protein IFT64_12105 [Oxalobacteraceae sp. CFBP 8753]|nr:hypothetical protein [Oxalobacteraceae sp. CFBP 8753]